MTFPCMQVMYTISEFSPVSLRRDRLKMTLLGLKYELQGPQSPIESLLSDVT